MIVAGLIIAIICGFIARSIAKGNGRRPTLAFFIGFFFGIFGVIAYLVAGKSQAMQLRETVNALNKLNNETKVRRGRPRKNA